MQFEPFQDRLSREIRNDLSATMGMVLDQLDLSAAQKVADRYLSSDIKSYYKDYINDRIARYQFALEIISEGPVDTFWRALVLWDKKLFFEVHEILEHAWYRATGDEKKILQAMIRAAGVYIKLEYGYTEAARKMANRALPVLMKHRAYIDHYFDSVRLIAALQNLNGESPFLLI
jgi:hypothetical protein